MHSVMKLNVSESTLSYNTPTEVKTVCRKKKKKDDKGKVEEKEHSQGPIVKKRRKTVLNIADDVEADNFEEGEVRVIHSEDDDYYEYDAFDIDRRRNKGSSRARVVSVNNYGKGKGHGKGLSNDIN